MSRNIQDGDLTTVVSNEEKRNEAVVAAGDSKDADDDTKCSICHELVHKDKFTLSCGHSFHRDCIRTWFAAQNWSQTTCPMCRASVSCIVPATLNPPARVKEAAVCMSVEWEKNRDINNYFDLSSDDVLAKVIATRKQEIAATAFCWKMLDAPVILQSVDGFPVYDVTTVQSILRANTGKQTAKLVFERTINIEDDHITSWYSRSDSEDDDIWASM